MFPKWMSLAGLGLVCVAALVLPLEAPRTTAAQGPFVERVNPRPRLLFAPGEYARFVKETTGVRRAPFDRMLEEVESLGNRNWNERDIQLESQALAARVMLDRRDRRGEQYLGYARRTMSGILQRQMFQRFSESHDLVTEGARWVEAMALAHDWLHPHWTPEERASINRWLRAEVDEWVDTNRIRRAAASPFRNDLARGTAAMVLAGLTLFDEPGFEATGRKALAHARPYYESMLAAHQYAGGGGGMTEGTFYGSFTAWAQVLTAEALFTGAGLRSAYARSPFYEARLRYVTHAAWPGYVTNQFGFNMHHLAPIFGDARRGPTGAALYHRATVLLLGKRFPGSPAARQAYWAANREETSRTFSREWAIFDVLYWSPEVRREPPAALSYREQTLGQVFARSDWTDEATWISFNAGPHLDTHQHYDAGNLTIFRGVDLLVDSGSLDNFGSSHWYNYYARTVAHNTITVTDPNERWAVIWGGVPHDKTVNDGGQRTAGPLTPGPTLEEYLANRAAYDHGRIERYAEGEWGVYIRADITNAYQNPEYQSSRPDGTRNRPKVTHVGREVVYLRQAEGRRDAVVVFDRVVSTDPGFRKAVLWHTREPFETAEKGNEVDEGEIRYEGQAEYDFQTLVPFREGKRQRESRLFVTALAVDPIVVREIGRRIPTETADHTTFGTGHKHRHVKDYFVEDPIGVMNDNKTTGALGRPEWPPFGPPEIQWLWNDDLAGGWGQTRLEVHPAAPRLADRFLTVLVPSDAANQRPPDIARATSLDGRAAAAVIRDGPRMEIVMFSADPNGAPLESAAIDAPAGPVAGDLTVTTLIPGTEYSIRAKTGGGVQRIVVTREAGGIAADQAGLIRVPLEGIPRARVGQPFPAQAGAVPAAAPAAVMADDRAAASSRPAAAARPSPPRHPGLILVDAREPRTRDDWNRRVDDMLVTGMLRVSDVVEDPLGPGRRHERLAQMHEGVPVFGGTLTRQLEGQQTLAIFGTLYRGVNVVTSPQLTPEEAGQRLQELSGLAPRSGQLPELIVLPADDGGYRLAYRARVVTSDDVVMYFVDANTGEALLAFSDLRRPAM